MLKRISIPSLIGFMLWNLFVGAAGAAAGVNMAVSFAIGLGSLGIAWWITRPLD